MKQENFKDCTIPIIEIFNSVSGEGISAGGVMTFVRSAGCNLRCSYCDTKYSYDEFDCRNKNLKPDEIIDIINTYRCKNILCTGGEPLELNKAKRYLPLYIASKGFKVRIETNGSCPVYSHSEIKEFIEDTNLLNLNYALDIKCPDSLMSENNIYEENFKMLGLGDELKFVVASQNDLDFGIDVIKKYSGVLAKSGAIINFSPVFGKIHPSNIVDILKENNGYFEETGLKVRLSLQIHKFIWPPEARGV